MIEFVAMVKLELQIDTVKWEFVVAVAVGPARTFDIEKVIEIAVIVERKDLLMSKPFWLEVFELTVVNVAEHSSIAAY